MGGDRERSRNTVETGGVRIPAVLTCLIFLALCAGALHAHAGSGETGAAPSGPGAPLRQGFAAAAATPTPTAVPPPYYPPASVTLEGNGTAAFGTLATFTARVNPQTATIPLTYHWQATGRPDATYFGYTIPSADYRAAWDSAGTKTITVTVSNIAGSAVTTRTVSVMPALTPPVAPDPAGWILSADPYVTGRSNSAGMRVGPATVTRPITYTWTVTDMDPIVHAASANVEDDLQLTWLSPGPKTLTVAASNIAGTITGSQQITVWALGYLPIVER